MIPLYFSGQLEIAFPPKEPPSWAPKVERWYQLDPFAYFLPEAYARISPASKPDSMLLACAGASNITDHAFAAGGALSPTKFVHTLPNIRDSSLLSVMGWEGPVLSLHRDPFTLSTAFIEALARAQGGAECWVWAANELGKVSLFAFGCKSGHTHQVSPRSQDSSASPSREDVEILRWFWDSKGTFDMSQQWMVRKG
jgi:hypothetical protein